MNLDSHVPVDHLLTPESLIALRRIGLNPALEAALRDLATRARADTGDSLPTRRAARVVEVQREHLSLHDGVQAWPARLLPRLRHELDAAGDTLAVGDWVLAEHDGRDPWWVAWRVPPRTQVARRLHDGRHALARAVLVANVDTALLVMGLDGDFNVRRLERYVTLVRSAGLTGVVVLTKADACERVDARLAEVAARVPPGMAVVAVDARAPQAAIALRPWLGPGQTLVALGSSGAGKSTLTNTLCAVGDDPDEAVAGATPTDPTLRPQATGTTRAGDGRGRHTTTTRSMHRTRQGACLIDTPGVRTLRLDADAGDVQAAFDDIARLAPQCRFRDCRHGDEPGCAVREAVAPDRLRHFQKLQRETRRDQLTVLERQAEQAVWRVRSKAARARNADKRR